MRMSVNSAVTKSSSTDPPQCANINVRSPKLLFHANSIYRYLFLFAKIFDACVSVFKPTIFIPNFPDQTFDHSLSMQLLEMVWENHF